MGTNQETTLMVTNPPHYRAGEYECNAVQDALAGTLWSGHPKVVRLGNGLKYLWRACSKGDFAENIRKAAFELLSAIDEDWRMRVPEGRPERHATLVPNSWSWDDRDGDRGMVIRRDSTAVLELDCIELEGTSIVYVETREQCDTICAILRSVNYEE